jgi:hypothetical protein
MIPHQYRGDSPELDLWTYPIFKSVRDPEEDDLLSALDPVPTINRALIDPAPLINNPIIIFHRFLSLISRTIRL